MSNTLEKPEALAKEVMVAVSQLEKLFLNRLRNFYNNELHEVMKTVRLPIQKQSDAYDWDLELTNIMSSLRS